MICSKCKLDLPEYNFSPKKYNQTSHYAASGELVVYKYKCKRGRHYNCNTCRSNAYHKKKGSRKVSADSALTSRALVDLQSSELLVNGCYYLSGVSTSL